MKARHVLSILAASLVFAACANAFASGAASAVTSAEKPPFPVKLERVTSDGQSYGGGLNLTWRSSVPGLTFCVAYASTHGADFHGWLGGKDHQSDREHCLSAGRDGTVTDTAPVEVWDLKRDPDALLIANVVLVDNEVSTETIPLQKYFKAH
ncbi:hypothetical protein AB4Y45_34180 [Paraburkholderia sp. EG287A]|uniref:hypothetical protein n=1 Tax=Paraburkholderia sp. EG287A TaxID=3237012 RepID=UPI0034D186E2